MTSTRGVHSGQIVAAQVGAALVLATAGHAAAVVAAAVLVVGAFGWFRQRWLHQWLRTVAGLVTRRRALPAGAGSAALLALAAPGTRLREAELDGQAAAVLADGHGMTAVLRLGDPGVLPDPVELPAVVEPDASLQLLISAMPGEPGTLAARQVMLAVRVHRTDGLAPDDLRHHLGSVVHRLRHRLRPLPTMLLGVDAARQAVTDLAHHDTAYPVRESWSAVHLGGLTQVTYRLPAVAAVTPHLLTLPAAATTVAHHGAELTVRVATGSVEDAQTADRALRRLLAAHAIPVRRLDGEHRSGLAATLPLAGAGPGWEDPARVEEYGLPLGMNRHGVPVLVALFRPEPTRAILLGQLPMARLLALRALRAGARVIIQTGRPGEWAHGPAGVEVAAPQQAVPATGRPWRPVLRVLDESAADTHPGRWCADIVVCGRAAPSSAKLLSRADVVIAQRLPEAEATVVSATLGLGRSGTWLSRTSPELVGAISRRTVRWALLSPTPRERQLLGPPPGQPRRTTAPHRDNHERRGGQRTRPSADGQGHG